MSMTRAERLLNEILKELITKKKSINWVEEEYNMDAKDILRAWAKRSRAERL